MELNPKAPVRFRTAAGALKRALDELTIAQDLIKVLVYAARDPDEGRPCTTKPVPAEDVANAYAGADELQELVDCIHKLRWASEAVVTAGDANAFFEGAHARALMRALEEENVDLPF